MLAEGEVVAIEEFSGYHRRSRGAVGVGVGSGMGVGGGDKWLKAEGIEQWEESRKILELQLGGEGSCGGGPRRRSRKKRGGAFGGNSGGGASG